MRWEAPSERTQLWLVSPILVPAFIVSAPVLLLFFGLMVASFKLSSWLTPSKDWHQWFAWRPVKLGHWSAPEGWAWLEKVERRSRPYDWPTEYRARATAQQDSGEGT